MKFLSSLLFLSVFSAPAFAIQCGETITSTVKLTQNLDCSSYSGFAALSLKGNGILKGQGFKVISPNTNVGIYAEGQTIKVLDTEIVASSSATGIMGYNVVRLVVDNVKATNMNIGVDYYTDVDYDCDRLKVVDSNLSQNNYGAKVISPKCEYFPRFARTDLSGSYQYALNLNAKILRIREVQDNIYDGSANGLLLKASESIFVEGLDLAAAQIDGTQIMAYSSPKIDIKNVKVGENQSEGIHIYDVADVTLKKVEAVNSGVGIKIANEQVNSSVKVSQSSTSGNSIGLLVAKYGSAQFNSVNVSQGNAFADAVSIAP